MCTPTRRKVGWPSKDSMSTRKGPASLGEDDPVLAPVDPLYHDTPVVYGPVFVFASANIAKVTGDGVIAAVLAYRLMAVVGLVIAAVAVHDLARGLGRDPVDALVLGFANPLVLLHLVSGAHNEAMMLAFLVTGVAVGRRPSLRFVGMALCAMAAAIKLPAILAVAFIGWPWVLEAERLRTRLLRIAAASGLAFVVIALAGRLTGWGWGWVDAITSTEPVDAYLSLTRVMGGGIALVTGLDLGSVLTVARLAGLLLAGGATLLLLFRGHRSWPLALAWSLLIWAILHPTTQPWYLTWGIMLLAASSAGERNRTFVTGCAVAAFVVLPVGPQLGIAHPRGHRHRYGRPRARRAGRPHVQPHGALPPAPPIGAQPLVGVDRGPDPSRGTQHRAVARCRSQGDERSSRRGHLRRRQRR